MGEEPPSSGADDEDSSGDEEDEYIKTEGWKKPSVPTVLPESAKSQCHMCAKPKGEPLQLCIFCRRPVHVSCVVHTHPDGRVSCTDLCSYVTVSR
eukprot:NODE_7158_length_415_cov_123.131148_g5521_i0.p2 GENE.NODE_7158_length_415_cov_123.131148_g5521_i0~~NODE_7158_length_415_cov_123.131148_g5521_i0.p2  ORF type:complete len:104 (-),score=36.09 NODE_7158_length_415_cov_123.131148_g5521_i0:104-388(-)